MRLLLLSFPILIATLIMTGAFAQSPTGTGFGRVQLSDVDIQGEANSDGMRFSQRQAHDISERLKLRTDFMDRVEELSPSTWSKPDQTKLLTTH